jgi:hypothetical protein
MMVETADQGPRNRALVALAITLLIGAGAWWFFGRATDAGLERMARIERAHAQCDSLRARARNREDSVRVSMTALADTIDPRSKDAIGKCGDLPTP